MNIQNKDNLKSIFSMIIFLIYESKEYLLNKQLGVVLDRCFDEMILKLQDLIRTKSTTGLDDAAEDALYQHAK